MTAVRAFDLGDVLTVTTGRLVSRHMDAIYDLLDFVTGDNLFAHQLPRAMEECRGPLLAQHPALTDVEVPDWPDSTTPEDIFGWVDSLRPTYGDALDVTPLDPADHTTIDPIIELGLRGVPAENVVVVVALDEDNDR